MVETFGAPPTDQDANREIFEEGVDILFKAFEGKPFSHTGKYYTIPPEVPYRGYTRHWRRKSRPRRSRSSSSAGIRLGTGWARSVRRSLVRTRLSAGGSSIRTLGPI